MTKAHVHAGPEPVEPGWLGRAAARGRARGPTQYLWNPLSRASSDRRKSLEFLVPMLRVLGVPLLGCSDSRSSVPAWHPSTSSKNSG